MKRTNGILATLSTIAGPARILGLRISALAADLHVPHWSDYLRQTRNR